jgi:hypothetical protein
VDFPKVTMFVRVEGGRYVELCDATNVPAKGVTIRIDTELHGGRTYRVVDVVLAYRDVDSLARLGAQVGGEIFTVYPSLASVYLDPVDG